MISNPACVFTRGGVIDFFVTIFTHPTFSSEDVTSFCWRTLKQFADNDRMLDGTQEITHPCPSSVCLEKGIFDLAVKCLQTTQAEDNTDQILRFLRYCASNPSCAPGLIKSGAHLVAIKYISTVDQWADPFDRSLILLHRLAAVEETRSLLRTDGALDCVLPHLDKLSSEDVDVLLRGFLSGSIVCRLAGKDETGIGPQVLRGNPLLISQTLVALDLALDDWVYGLLLNPHSITMDLANLASSDENKPLLKPAIPVLIQALTRRGSSNAALVKDVLKIFLHLTFEKDCFKELQSKFASTINPLFVKLVKEPEYDMESRMSLKNLQDQMMPPPAAAARRASGQLPVKPAATWSKSLMGKVMLKTKEAPAPVLATPTPPPRHIMISYNWGVQPLALLVDEGLKKHNFQTWIDVYDMGEDLNDSMAFAVENAACLFVFLTSNYKESGNCRKECEYADSNKVPIVYILAEQGYVPNGWLGILLGKTIYHPVWTPEHVNEQMNKLVDKAKLYNAAALTPLDSRAPAPVKSPKPVAAQHSGKSGGGGGEGLKADFEAYKKETDEKIQKLTAQVQALVGELQEIKKRI